MDTVRGIGIVAQNGYPFTLDSCTVTNAGNDGIQFTGAGDFHLQAGLAEIRPNLSRADG